ncbi:MAG: hydrolase [Epulopiscium sp.]|nr:hydrolase [Candidatus Epulonipiscium sp.]
MSYELLIQNGSMLYSPAVVGDIVWSTDRKGSPGQLTFDVLKSGALNFTEGNPVRLKKDGKEIFYGFIFTKKRDKKGLISVTAYDQLRYFKNKDTYVYTNKTATEFLKTIANDFRLQIGDVEDTRYKIPSRVEDNTTLFDMMENALGLTLENTNQIFILYDDFGKITLKNIKSMKLDLLIDEETGENFDYTSSIDSDTYNKVKLVRDNEESGKREVYMAQHSENMNKWGVLQYFDTLQEKENGKVKAEGLLALYKNKRRKLAIKNAFGDPRVRAGSLIPVILSLGDIKANNYMLVEKCKHTFSLDKHVMDLTLRGGEFIE